MKKTILFIFTILCIFALFSCDDGDTSGSSATQSSLTEGELKSELDETFNSAFSGGNTTEEIMPPEFGGASETTSTTPDSKENFDTMDSLVDSSTVDSSKKEEMKSELDDIKSILDNIVTDSGKTDSTTSGENDMFQDILSGVGSDTGDKEPDYKEENSTEEIKPIW